MKYNNNMGKEWGNNREYQIKNLELFGFISPISPVPHFLLSTFFFEKVMKW